MVDRPAPTRRRRVQVLLVALMLSAAPSAQPAAREAGLAPCDGVCGGALVPCERQLYTSGSHPPPTRRAPSRWRVPWRQLRGLSSRQRRFCRRHPDLVPALLTGARAATSDCRRRFRHTRWNCHALGQHLNFGHVQVKGTREAAVMYGLQAAATTVSVYAACRRGHVAGCTCRPRRPDTRAVTFWKWSGCRSGLRYSAKQARLFLNARERETDALSFMNRHNNRAGVKAVTRRLRRRCHCHGPSGSCSLRTCWRDAPRSVAVVGDRLQLEMTRALLVQLSAGQLRRVPAGSRPPKHRLVHLERSPSYCDRDPETGHNGTAGRHCRRSRALSGNCAYLCCGRGYNMKIVQRSFCCNYHETPIHPTVCLKWTWVRTCK